MANYSWDENLTDQQILTLKSKLGMAGSVGLLTQQGVTLSYVVEQNTVHITIQEKSGMAAFASNSYIKSRVHQMIEEALG